MSPEEPVTLYTCMTAGPTSTASEAPSMLGGIAGAAVPAFAAAALALAASKVKVIRAWSMARNCAVERSTFAGRSAGTRTASPERERAAVTSFVRSACAPLVHCDAPGPDQDIVPYAVRSGIARMSDDVIGTGTNCFGSKIRMKESARPVVVSVNAMTSAAAATVTHRGARGNARAKEDRPLRLRAGGAARTRA